MTLKNIVLLGLVLTGVSYAQIAVAQTEGLNDAVNACSNTENTDDERISACTKFLDLKNPGVPRAQRGMAYALRAMSYIKKGDYDRAITDFDAAIQLHPLLPDTYFLRGFAYSRKGQHDQAISNYDQAIRLDPKKASAYVQRGISFVEEGEHSRAIGDFEEALRIGPQAAYVNELLEQSRANLALASKLQSSPSQHAASTPAAPSVSSDKPILDSNSVQKNAPEAAASPAKTTVTEAEYKDICRDNSSWDAICKNNFVVWSGKITDYLDNDVVRIRVADDLFSVDLTLKKKPEKIYELWVNQIGAEIVFSGIIKKNNIMYDDLAQGEIVQIVRSATDISASIVKAKKEEQARADEFKNQCLAASSDIVDQISDRSLWVSVGDVRTALQEATVYYASEMPVIKHCFSGRYEHLPMWHKNDDKVAITCGFDQKNSAKPTVRIYKLRDRFVMNAHNCGSTAKGLERFGQTWIDIEKN